VALISSAPSDVPTDWFLTNEMMAQARATVNARLGGRRLLTHAIFTPGQPGWMEALERALVDLKPDSMKGYTIGDNTNKDQSRHPWRLDDEQLLDGPVKNAILGENVARLYRYNRHAELAGPSHLAEPKAEYERRGIGRSNRRYGYVVVGG